MTDLESIVFTARLLLLDLGEYCNRSNRTRQLQTEESKEKSDDIAQADK